MKKLIFTQIEVKGGIDISFPPPPPPPPPSGGNFFGKDIAIK
jgi:hypothetical protein